ncbi:patatin-like phospholipase family protein [Maritimibacter dapengensis]|uniref:Patatin-like phospholipase family protein n=1 Tax=Maritimibacter dapengensis TaxID=2836868 RepID=A0ABS6T3B0_9RHOB|nr:patatin-like phospholipase family protein [Maritimibacter dapengensis]MBV7379735.1 patatin-like phospholipase family protein [Maritimibacter dapengensis]
MDDLPTNPAQIVFSGGGLRCFWQGGFMTRLAKEGYDFDPQRITGVSGGALAGSAWIADIEQRLLDEMCAAFEDRDSNLDLFDPDENGITPHQELYCDVVNRVLDADTARKIASGPAFQIQIAHPPDTGLPTLTGTALAAAYEAELHIVGSPHFNWAEKMGLTASLVDANRAARDGKLTELVSAAAVIPPVFEPPLWNDRRVVDGGMADQAPLPDPDDGETLILLTRPYKKLPDVPGRTYVWPSEETPADKIDFTNPQKLRDTWDLGAQDAERYLLKRE